MWINKINRCPSWPISINFIANGNHPFGCFLRLFCDKLGSTIHEITSSIWSQQYNQSLQFNSNRSESLHWLLREYHLFYSFSLRILNELLLAVAWNGNDIVFFNNLLWIQWFKKTRTQKEVERNLNEHWKYLCFVCWNNFNSMYFIPYHRALTMPTGVEQ